MSQSDDLQFKGVEILTGSPREAKDDSDASKPFRGILIGLAIVSPIWLVIGLVLYAIL